MHFLSQFCCPFHSHEVPMSMPKFGEATSVLFALNGATHYINPGKSRYPFFYIFFIVLYVFTLRTMFHLSLGVGIVKFKRNTYYFINTVPIGCCF